MNLSDWREDYDKYSIDDSKLPSDPFSLFKSWFDQAIKDKNPEPNAFVLSSVSGSIPQSRVLLLKEIENDKFVFYSNYNSQKGKDIDENPNVSLLFFYIHSQRQIRINGTAEKLSRTKAIEYFKSRPLESQISAAASPQSEMITKKTLISNVEELRSIDAIECPEHWGGYAVSPYKFEFWQGQPARLHDRIIYKKYDNNWDTHRLAP